MNPIDLLKFLGDNPGLLWPLLVLAVIWPMLRRVGSVIERAADGLIVAAPLPQITAFIFLVHFIVVLISVVICLVFTEHIPPGIDQNWRGPLGPQADRVLTWIPSLFGAAILFAPLLARSELKGEARQKAEVVANVVVFGVAASAFTVGYSALFENSLMEFVPKFDAAIFAFAWWFSFIPVLSFSTSIVSLLIYLSVRGLWALAGRIAN